MNELANWFSLSKYIEKRIEPIEIEKHVDGIKHVENSIQVVAKIVYILALSRLIDWERKTD